MEILLPRYTILLPLYKEKKCIEQLIKAIVELRYPTHLLQVLILIEKDDRLTME